MFSFLKSKNSGTTTNAGKNTTKSNQDNGKNDKIKSETARRSTTKSTTAIPPEQELYIQVFNIEGDTVFVALTTGRAYWSLPSLVSYHQVKYFSHINSDDGRCYYENTTTSTVTWTVPNDDTDITSVARSIIVKIDAMTRSDVEKLIGTAFTEEIQATVNDEIDQFFEQRDQWKADTEKEDDSPLPVTVVAKDTSHEELQKQKETKKITIPVIEEYYIQTFNNDGDPVFVGLTSGNAYWLLPNNALFAKVKLFSHINEEDGRLYFEDAETNVVTWSLPIDNQIVYQAGYDTIMKIDNLTRAETEELIGQPYCESEIQKQNEQLDNYLEEREEKKKIQAAIVAASTPATAPASASNPSTSSNRTSLTSLFSKPAPLEAKNIVKEELKVSKEEIDEDDSKDLFYEKELRYLDETYIQTFNHDGDTVIIGLRSGLVYWIYPKEFPWEKISFFSHANEEDGRLYFEDAMTGKVTWSLPEDERIISTIAKEMIEKIDEASRKETEVIIGQRFSEDDTNTLNDEIDLYLAQKDEERKKQLSAPQTQQQHQQEQLKQPAISLTNKPLENLRQEDKLVQSFNIDGDTVIISLLSGKLSWIIPSSNKIDDVIYLTHADEDGKITFEEVMTGKILQTPPAVMEGKVSAAASQIMLKVTQMNRKETEKMIGSPYNDSVTDKLNEALEEYLERVDEIKKSQPASAPAPAAPAPIAIAPVPFITAAPAPAPAPAPTPTPAIQPSTDKASLTSGETPQLVLSTEKVRRRSSFNQFNNEKAIAVDKLHSVVTSSISTAPEIKAASDVSRKGSYLPVSTSAVVSHLAPAPRLNTLEEGDEDSEIHLLKETVPNYSSEGPKPIDEKYMQCFNVEGDTLLIGLLSGKLYWNLPPWSYLEDIVYLTHLHDDGRIFFEEIGTGSFLWTAPAAQDGFISKAAHRMMIVVEPMTREETELIVETPFNEAVTNAFNKELEEYLERIDLLRKQTDHANNPDDLSLRRTSFNHFNGNKAKAITALQQFKASTSSNPSALTEANLQQNMVQLQRNSSTSKIQPPTPKNNSAMKIVIGGDEPIVSRDKGQILKPTTIFSGYLKKLATQSGRNWKKRFIVLTAFSISYYETDKQAQQVTTSATNKAKGEILITADSDVQLYPAVHGEGYGFKFFNKKESIIFASITDEDRKKWMTKLRDMIILNKSFLKTSTLFTTLLKLPTNTTPEKLLTIPLKVLKTYEKRQYLILSKNYLYFYKDENHLSYVEDALLLDKTIQLSLILHPEGGQFFYFTLQNKGNSEAKVFHYVLWYQGSGNGIPGTTNTAPMTAQKALYEFNIWKDAIEKYTQPIVLVEEKKTVEEMEFKDRSGSSLITRPSLATFFKVPTLFSTSNAKEEKDPSIIRRKTRQNSIIRASVRTSVTGEEEGSMTRPGSSKRQSASSESAFSTTRESLKGADALATAALRKKEKQRSLNLNKSLLAKEEDRTSRFDYNWDVIDEPTTSSMEPQVSSATTAATITTPKVAEEVNLSNFGEGLEPLLEAPKKSRRESFSNNARKGSINRGTETTDSSVGMINTLPSIINENNEKTVSERLQSSPSTMNALEKLFNTNNHEEVRSPPRSANKEAEPSPSRKESVNPESAIPKATVITKVTTATPITAISTKSADPVRSAPAAKTVKISELKKKALEKVNQESATIASKQSQTNVSQSSNNFPLPTSPIPSSPTEALEDSSPKNAFEIAALRRKSKKPTENNIESSNSRLGEVFDPIPQQETVPSKSIVATEEDNSLSPMRSPSIRRQSTRRQSIKPPPLDEVVVEAPVLASPPAEIITPPVATEISQSSLQRVFNFEMDKSETLSIGGGSIVSAPSTPRNALEMAAHRKSQRSNSTQSHRSNSSLDSSHNSVTMANAMNSLNSVFGTIDGDVQPFRSSISSSSTTRSPSYHSKSAIQKWEETIVVHHSPLISKRNEDRSSITRPFEEIKVNHYEERSSSIIPDTPEEAGLSKLNALEAAKLRKKLKNSSALSNNKTEVIRQNHSTTSSSTAAAAKTTTVEDPKVKSILQDYHSYNKSNLIALNEFLEKSEEQMEKIAPARTTDNHNNGEKVRPTGETTTTIDQTHVTQNTRNAIRRQSELKEKRRQSFHGYEKKEEEEKEESSSERRQSSSMIQSTMTAEVEEKRETPHKVEPTTSASSAELKNSIQGIFGSIDSPFGSPPASDSENVFPLPSPDHSKNVPSPSLNPSSSTHTGIKDAALKKIAKRPSITTRRKESFNFPEIEEKDRDSIDSDLPPKEESIAAPINQLSSIEYTPTVRFRDTPPTAYSPAQIPFGNPFLQSLSDDEKEEKEEVMVVEKVKHSDRQRDLPSVPIKREEEEDELEEEDREDSLVIEEEIILRSSMGRNSVSHPLFDFKDDHDESDSPIILSAPAPPFSSPSSSLLPQQPAEGYVNAIDLFKVNQNKPLAKIVFENYSCEKVMDFTSIQQFSYDFGVYMTTNEIIEVIQENSTACQRAQRPSNKSNNHHTAAMNSQELVLSYEDFLIFWRNHPLFSSMKANDKSTKRRLFIAYLFRKYDPLQHGQVKMNDFATIYARLLESNYLNAKKHKINDIVKSIDPYYKGKIEMNRFLDWLTNNVKASSNRPSALSRIWSSLSGFGGSKDDKNDRGMNESPDSMNNNSRSTTPNSFPTTTTSVGGNNKPKQPLKSDPYQDDLWNQHHRVHPPPLKEIEIDLSDIPSAPKATTNKQTLATAAPALPLPAAMAQPPPTTTRSPDVKLDLSNKAKIKQVTAAASSEGILDTTELTFMKPSLKEAKVRSELSSLSKDDIHQEENDDSSVGSKPSIPLAATTNKKKNLFTRRKSVMKMTGKEKEEAKEAPLRKTVDFDMEKEYLTAKDHGESLTTIPVLPPPSAPPAPPAPFLSKTEDVIPTSFSTYSSTSLGENGEAAVANPLLALKQKSIGGSSKTFSAPPPPPMPSFPSTIYGSVDKTTTANHTNSATVGNPITKVSGEELTQNNSGAVSNHPHPFTRKNALPSYHDDDYIEKVLSIDTAFLDESSESSPVKRTDNALKSPPPPSQSAQRRTEEEAQFSRSKVKKVECYTPEQRYGGYPVTDEPIINKPSNNPVPASTSSIVTAKPPPPAPSSLSSSLPSSKKLFLENPDSMNKLLQSSTLFSPSPPPPQQQQSPINNHHYSFVEKRESHALLISPQPQFIQQIQQKRGLFMQLLQVTKEDINHYLQEHSGKPATSSLLENKLQINEESLSNEENFFVKFLKENPLEIKKENEEEEELEIIDPATIPIDELFEIPGAEDDTDAEEEEEEQQPQQQVNKNKKRNKIPSTPLPTAVFPYQTSSLPTTPSQSSTTSSTTPHYHQLLTEKQMMLQSINYLHHYYYSSKQKILLYQIHSLQRIILQTEQQIHLLVSQRDYLRSLYQLYCEEIIQKNNQYYQQQQQQLIQYVHQLHQLHTQKEYQIYALLQSLQKKCEDLHNYSMFYQCIQQKNTLTEQELSSLVEVQTIVQEEDHGNLYNGREGTSASIVVGEGRPVDSLRKNDLIAYHRQIRQMEEQKKYQENHRIREMVLKKLQKKKQRRVDKIKRRQGGSYSESPERSGEGSESSRRFRQSKDSSQYEDDEDEGLSLDEYNSDTDDQQPKKYQPTLKKPLVPLNAARLAKYASSSEDNEERDHTAGWNHQRQGQSLEEREEDDSTSDIATEELRDTLDMYNSD